MKKIISVIAIAILVSILFIRDNKIYGQIICSLVVIILLGSTIVEFYKYQENNERISEKCITLQRDALMSEIILGVLLAQDIFRDMSDYRYIVPEKTEIFLSISLLVMLGLQIYISIFHIPKVTISGFLCSNGKFIPFSSIRSIGCETLVLNNKKLTVNYGEKSGEFFKISKVDYENVKEHLLKYGSLSINEAS